MLTDLFDVVDQVRSRVVDEGSERSRIAGTALIEEDDTVVFRVEAASIFRVATCENED
jgi:hypothetical protein